MSVIAQYLQSIRTVCPEIPDEALHYLAQQLSVVELKPKHFYIQAGEIQQHIGWVAAGVLRTFYIDEKGNDKTFTFVSERQFATHFPSLSKQEPCRFYFQCLEHTTLINIPYRHLLDCCDRFVAFDKYLRMLLQEAHNELLLRVESSLFDNAETRYLNFIKNNPTLFSRVSVTHLCSFLGIERQHLTRIRKKLL